MTQEESTLDDEQFYTSIREAWSDGRSIVPIIGAGASADSGFPPLASVVRYIAKLKCYLEHRLYLPTPEMEKLFGSYVPEVADRADKFISIFGWPDRFQLNADLRNRIHKLESNKHLMVDWEKDPQFSQKGLMEFALCKSLDELAKKINPGGS